MKFIAKEIAEGAPSAPDFMILMIKKGMMTSIIN